MLLGTHITVAILSIIAAFVKHSFAKYLVILTVLSGGALSIITPSTLGKTCLSGFIYFAILFVFQRFDWVKAGGTKGWGNTKYDSDNCRYSKG